MGDKSRIFFYATVLFFVSIGIAQTEPFIGFITNSGSMWNCTGYCKYETSCGWTVQLVESDTDPTGTVCCIEGLLYSPYGPASTSPIDKLAFIIGAKHYWSKCTAVYSPEICNGFDDDGDGLVDEYLNKTCSTNVGICTQGVQICTNGVWSSCTGTMPGTEKCNGLDDDCDGTVDEGCITYPTYTGYNHYCKDITLSQKSDVTVTAHFQSINDSYARYFMTSLDCSYSEGKNLYLSSGCSYVNCVTGRYCYTGVGSSGTYTYKFDDVLAGNHRICLWPSSPSGYLWNISMQYTATPVEEEPPQCTTGASCVVDRANYCNSWLCEGYCTFISYLSACQWVTDYLKVSETDPTGTKCCSELFSGEGSVDENIYSKYYASFIPIDGDRYDVYWQSCRHAYGICDEVTGSLPGYYNASCVCHPKKVTEESCSEDYMCYNTQCISGKCQAEEVPEYVCGDGVCESPESSEYCAEGSCCTYEGGTKNCWVYCPQDCVPDKTFDSRIWPVDSDVDYCINSKGVTYPATGENAAYWFIWGGCAHWYVFDVPQGEMIRMQVYTDSCPGCVCYYPNFKIYKYVGGTWVLEGQYDLPDVKGITENLYKTFDSGKIKVETSQCFYMKLWKETTYTCGDGVCETDEMDSCQEDCGHLSIQIALPNVTVGNKAYFSLIYSHTPTVSVKDPNNLAVTVIPHTEASDEGGLYSRAYEFTPSKTGTYTINAYIEVSGVKTKEVTGTISSLAPLPTDVCGDGICGATETNTSCPADCYITPTKYCGDDICESYETNCYQDCGYLDVYTTKKSVYVDENAEFRINHTPGDVSIAVSGPNFNSVSFYSIYAVSECNADFCLDKYYFKPAKAGTYTVNVQLTTNENTLFDSDYVTASGIPADPSWILLVSGDHVDSGHYLCGEITLEYQSIVKIKGVFRNVNDQYARFLLSCVDCGDILNTWALNTNEGWGLYSTETRCDDQKSSGQFCIMGCCSEGTYINSYNISAGTHTLCIWPTCPDKYSDVDRKWEADLYYNISYEYIPTGDVMEVNVTGPHCGNGVHDPGENHNNCCVDVGCPAHQYCSDSNECVKENMPPGGGPQENETESYCGDGVHDPGETKENCCVDVGCPAHHYCSESTMKCVRQAQDVNPTIGLVLALNGETLYIKMSNLKQRVIAIRDYYYGRDPSKYSAWDEIVSEFDSILSALEDMKDYLKANKENLTNAVFEEARRMITEVKDDIKELILNMLEVL